MLQYLNQDDMDNKYLKVNFIDPSSALILVQGHQVLHVCMGIMVLLVKKSQSKLQCYQYNTLIADQYAQYETTGDILNENVKAMFWVHLACFLMLGW